MEVKKITFGHQAESEGYGAGITYASFEEQFVGAKIDFSVNTYALQQRGNELVSGKNNVDGISGATTTSLAVVTMLNEGLVRYKPFLQPSKGPKQKT